MEEEKDAFYVVKKKDVFGIYRSLWDLQAQAGISVYDPSLSVYKGYGLSKQAEMYLGSCGLKNAAYSISASDVTDNIFGKLVPCPRQLVEGDGVEDCKESLFVYECPTIFTEEEVEYCKERLFVYPCPPGTELKNWHVELPVIFNREEVEDCKKDSSVHLCPPSTKFKNRHSTELPLIFKREGMEDCKESSFVHECPTIFTEEEVENYKESSFVYPYPCTPGTKLKNWHITEAPIIFKRGVEECKESLPVHPCPPSTELKNRHSTELPLIFNRERMEDCRESSFVHECPTIFTEEEVEDCKESSFVHPYPCTPGTKLKNWHITEAPIIFKRGVEECKESLPVHPCPPSTKLKNWHSTELPDVLNLLRKNAIN